MVVIRFLECVLLLLSRDVKCSCLNGYWCQ
uniref:Uncharacterized protein n=1 Tax=Anguilla anguilla TaxID=7936 RepID=A0A0E9VTT7_ANGAN